MKAGIAVAMEDNYFLGLVGGFPGEVKFTITAEAKLNTEGTGNSTSPEEETIRRDTLIQTLLVEVQ